MAEWKARIEWSQRGKGMGWGEVHVHKRMRGREELVRTRIPLSFYTKGIFARVEGKQSLWRVK